MNIITPNIGIIGSSPQIIAAIERLREVAPTDLSVLITGESGTGKEVFAQALHALSKRRARRMVSINCGAIPEQLLESELFGSEKGAFTGATEQRKGFFEAADHSTIFLDELGEMPLGTQVKLLRVLESGEFSRLGSPETLRTDVRVIAATNRRLEEEVAQGKFRRDLYYRLNTVQIELPALREHSEDIPELVAFFAERTAHKIGTAFQGVSHEALDILQRLPWAGNIRELRNLIETIVTLGKGQLITPESLRPYLPKALKQPDVVFKNESWSTENTSNDNTYEAFDQRAIFNAPEVIIPQQSQHLLPQHSLPQHSLPQHSLPQHSFNPAQTLVRVPQKTPEQVERELMYKALLDLVREVASLRGEIAEIKDVLYTNNRLEETSSMKLDGSEMLSSEEITLGTMTMQEVEKRLIGAALERYEGNRRQTAEALGISERTLYRKLHEYGLLKD
jgi:transcriptional regulator with PAS, ATPase and Fis domain